MDLEFRMAEPTKPSIPASIFLTARVFKLYRRWQRLYTTVDDTQQGYIPTALEYEDFQQWLWRQDSGYFSDIYEDPSAQTGSAQPGTFESDLEQSIATICRHELHPAAMAQPYSRCPVCTISLHLRYVHVLTHAMENAGGRAPSCTLMASEYQDNVYNAWLYVKLCALKEVIELERMAEQEEIWSLQDCHTVRDDLQTAQKALKLYWSQIGDCDSTILSTKKSETTSKTVSFTEGTDFELGRPVQYFWRRSPRYESGKYACVEREVKKTDTILEGVQNTSCKMPCTSTAEYPTSGSRASGVETFFEYPSEVSESSSPHHLDWEDSDADDASVTSAEDEPVDTGEMNDFEAQTAFIVFGDG